MFKKMKPSDFFRSKNADKNLRVRIPAMLGEGGEGRRQITNGTFPCDPCVLVLKTFQSYEYPESIFESKFLVSFVLVFRLCYHLGLFCFCFQQRELERRN